MTKETADEVYTLAINAIESLTSVLNVLPKDLPTEERDAIRRGVGTAIGDIQVDLLELITLQFPELDDLSKP